MNLQDQINLALASFDENFKGLDVHMSDIKTLKYFIQSRLTLLAESFKEMVPDEYENNFTTAYADWTPEKAIEEEANTQGHNSCRTETLDNLNTFLGL